MKKINKAFTNKFGIGILEVTIAVFVLIAGLIPIYRSLSIFSATEIETTKLAMAREILNSLRNEVLNQPFKELQKTSFPPQTEFDLPQQLYITNLQKVLDAEKKYKDFELTQVKAKFNNSERTIAEIKATITWTKNNSEKHEEKLSFLWVLKD
ncbi:MAG: hypothetical protein HQM08_17165 [Candidatus Riflebacteria bacterium]|nr:hypothetical protein [Candidatus Riflebacteria bacterium]